MILFDFKKEINTIKSNVDDLRHNNVDLFLRTDNIKSNVDDLRHNNVDLFLRIDNVKSNIDDLRHNNIDLFLRTDNIKSNVDDLRHNNIDLFLRTDNIKSNVNDLRHNNIKNNLCDETAGLPLSEFIFIEGSARTDISFEYELPDSHTFTFEYGDNIEFVKPPSMFFNTKYACNDGNGITETRTIIDNNPVERTCKYGDYPIVVPRNSKQTIYSVQKFKTNFSVTIPKKDYINYRFDWYAFGHIKKTRS